MKYTLLPLHIVTIANAAAKYTLATTKQDKIARLADSDAVIIAEIMTEDERKEALTAYRLFKKYNARVVLKVSKDYITRDVIDKAIAVADEVIKQLGGEAQ